MGFLNIGRIVKVLLQLFDITGVFLKAMICSNSNIYAILIIWVSQLPLQLCQLIRQKHDQYQLIAGTEYHHMHETRHTLLLFGLA
jgi:hypothetical protein